MTDVLLIAFAVVLLLGVAIGWFFRAALVDGDPLSRDLRDRTARTRATLDGPTRTRIKRDRDGRATPSHGTGRLIGPRMPADPLRVNRKKPGGGT